MKSRNSSEATSLIDLQRFELLVDAISDYAIYMLDTTGNVVSWNTGAERFKGYKADEIVGQHFARFFTEEDRAAGLPQKILSVAEKEGRFESEGWRIRKDGSRFWANAIIDAIRSDDGGLLGFAKITRDITARQSAEEALRQSEQQFRLLVQGVTDYAIFMLDTTGHVTNWNAGAQRIKGYTEEEIVGSHFSRFYTEEDRLTDLPGRALQIAKTEGRFEQEGWRLRKDGTRFFAHVIIDALHDPTGALAGFAKITRDISEKRAAAEMLKRTEQALQHAQKMESIGKLTGGVAHDFNNLLQIISGNLQLLALELNNNERAQTRIEAALDGVLRGKKLANYLLAFGRRQALDPKVVNLGRHIIAMEDMLRRTLGESIEVEMIVSGGLWNTLVDVAQVENALLNLAINSRDAMEEGGKLTIEIGNAYLDDSYVQVNPDVTAGQYVMICVSDTGVGIPENILTQVFDPFFSTKPEGKGSGLGLSMVYGFVKQSGGHVQIYSEVDHGTSVKLYLPRSLKAEDQISKIAPTPVVGGSETILVAEDDNQLCATVVEMLSELGYRVLKANDAAGALAIIESGVHIDLLFTDVVMPGPLRSTELAQKAKALHPNIGVLFTSGYTQNAIVHGGRLDPGVELLSKPYTREALARKIRHVLANQKHIAQLKAKIAEAAAAAQSGVSEMASSLQTNSLQTTSSPKTPLEKSIAETDTQTTATQKTTTSSASKSSPLQILLVEDEPIIRLNTTYLLQKLGHTVISAASKDAAIAAMQNHAFDILVTDINLPDASGIELAIEAKKITPNISVVYATGQTLANDTLDDAVVLNKPYTINTLETALRDSRNH